MGNIISNIPYVTVKNNIGSFKFRLFIRNDNGDFDIVAYKDSLKITNLSFNIFASANLTLTSEFNLIDTYDLPNSKIICTYASNDKNEFEKEYIFKVNGIPDYAYNEISEGINLNLISENFYNLQYGESKPFYLESTTKSELIQKILNDYSIKNEIENDSTQISDYYNMNVNNFKNLFLAKIHGSKSMLLYELNNKLIGKIFDKNITSKYNYEMLVKNNKPSDITENDNIVRQVNISLFNRDIVYSGAKFYDFDIDTNEFKITNVETPDNDVYEKIPLINYTMTENSYSKENEMNNMLASVNVAYPNTKNNIGNIYDIIILKNLTRMEKSKLSGKYFAIGCIDDFNKDCKMSQTLMLRKI
jgi:hypothetical protein